MISITFLIFLLPSKPIEIARTIHPNPLQQNGITWFSIGSRGTQLGLIPAHIPEIQIFSFSDVFPGSTARSPLYEWGPGPIARLNSLGFFAIDATKKPAHVQPSMPPHRQSTSHSTAFFLLKFPMQQSPKGASV